MYAQNRDILDTLYVKRIGIIHVHVDPSVLLNHLGLGLGWQLREYHMFMYVYVYVHVSTLYTSNSYFIGLTTSDSAFMP